jgi:hypothetical protein
VNAFWFCGHFQTRATLPDLLSGAYSAAILGFLADCPKDSDPLLCYSAQLKLQEKFCKKKSSF